MSDSLWPHGLEPIRLLCPWDFPGKNTRLGSHSLLQGIFVAQGFNPGVLHYRHILHCLSPQASPVPLISNAPQGNHIWCIIFMVCMVYIWHHIYGATYKYQEVRS